MTDQVAAQCGGIYKKINQVYQEVSKVIKGAEVGYGRNMYKAVQHDDVTNLLHDPITKHELITIPNVTDCTMEYQEYKTKDGPGKRFVCNNWVELKVVDINDGSFVTSRAFAMAFDTQDKAPGKAYSMALKYCYLKLFMLASGDDEEQRMDENKGQSNANNYMPRVSTNSTIDNNMTPAQKSAIWAAMKDKKLTLNEMIKPAMLKLNKDQASKVVIGLREVRDQNQFDSLIFNA